MTLSLTRRSLFASPGLVLAQSLLPGAPDSAERRAPITALEKQVAGLPGKFERGRHRTASGWSIPYRLFRPQPASGKLPLVVYLHGSGGLGDDNAKQITGGNIIPANVWATAGLQQRHPCFIVAPQTDRGWLKYATLDVPAGTRPQVLPGLGEGAAACVELIEKLLAELAIDERRIYLTGQSMGGGGTWNLLAHRGELFAAAVPYCGSVSLDTGAENPKIPVWNFHGDADDTVNVKISRDRIAARRRTGGQPRATEYAGVGHMVSPWACSEPDLPEWLFAQKRGA